MQLTESDLRARIEEVLLTPEYRRLIEGSLAVHFSMVSMANGPEMGCEDAVHLARSQAERIAQLSLADLCFGSFEMADAGPQIYLCLPGDPKQGVEDMVLLAGVFARSDEVYLRTPVGKPSARGHAWRQIESLL